uniref:Uncharacterized protein n=1 Tax=Arundo donax TaxID=35708 RepID=A0A0A8Z077_ARUDO
MFLILGELIDLILEKDYTEEYFFMKK